MVAVAVAQSITGSITTICVIRAILHALMWEALLAMLDAGNIFARLPLPKVVTQGENALRIQLSEGICAIDDK